LFKLFDFNSIGSISFTDLECLFTYAITSIFKLHHISLAHYDFSIIKNNLLEDILNPNERVNLKQLTKLFNHRLITEFLHQFNMPVVIPSKRLKSIIEKLSTLYNEPYDSNYTSYARNFYITKLAIYSALSSKRFRNYRTWLNKVIMPNLNSKATNTRPKLSLEWIYGISYSSNPIVQFAIHDPKLVCKSLLYTAGVAVIIYNYYSNTQKYYLQHRVFY